MAPAGSAVAFQSLRAAITRIEAASPSTARAPRVGGLQEVVPARPGDGAAACGFTLALAARLGRGPIVWIVEDFVVREAGAPYAPGLLDHGLSPGRLLIVRVPGPQQALWAFEEALKSPACRAVVGELWQAARHCDLAATRRLVVAARGSGSEGFVLHGEPPAGALSTAAHQRFEVRALPGRTRFSAAGRRLLPLEPAWGVRVLKARAQAGFLQRSDPEALREIAWTPNLSAADFDLLAPPPALTESTGVPRALSFPADRRRASA